MKKVFNRNILLWVLGVVIVAGFAGSAAYSQLASPNTTTSSPTRPPLITPIRPPLISPVRPGI